MNVSDELKYSIVKSLLVWGSCFITACLIVCWERLVVFWGVGVDFLVRGMRAMQVRIRVIAERIRRKRRRGFMGGLSDAFISINSPTG